MLDVRRLIWRARDLSKTLMWLAAVLAVAAAWTGAKLKRSILPKLAGGLGAIGVIALLVRGVMNRVAAGGFAQMFVKMHEVLFTNDLWLMDPQKHILIRIMPQPLFEQAFLNGANMTLRMFVIALLGLAAAHFTVAGMIRRHVAKGE